MSGLNLAAVLAIVKEILLRWAKDCIGKRDHISLKKAKYGNTQILVVHGCKMLVKHRYGFYTFKVIPNAKMFVWRVYGIAIQAKAH